MKKVLLAAIFFLTFSKISWAGQAPSVYINGNLLSLQNAPVIENNRVLVPLRAIFEALGQNVLWNMDDQSITSNGIWLQIGNPLAKVKSSEITLDAPAEIIGDRTYVPLRFVAESLGKKATWDGTNNRVDINDDVYRAKLKATKELIDTNAGLYQNITDETLSLWKSSLDKNYESSGFYIDKNVTSLEYKSIYANLDNRDKDIRDSMDSLAHTNPDNQYAYVALKDYYNVYLDLKSLAASPGGSFYGYNNSVTEIKNRMNSAKIKLESLLN